MPSERRAVPNPRTIAAPESRNALLAEEIASELRKAVNESRQGELTMVTLYQFVLLAMNLLSTGKNSRLSPPLTDQERRIIVVDALLIYGFNVNLSEEQLLEVERVALDVARVFQDVYARRVQIAQRSKVSWAHFRQACCCCCRAS